VLDVMLPGRSGFDILRDLRADTVTQGIPVMMLTARCQHERRSCLCVLRLDLFDFAGGGNFARSHDNTVG